MTLMDQMTWMTLSGLALLFVGAFVLWVYGSEKAHAALAAVAPASDEVSRARHASLVHWFLLYGGLAIFAGIGLLLTASVVVLF